MKKEMKLLIITALIILIILIFVATSKTNHTEKQILSAYDEIFEIQREVDIEIEQYKNDSQYTMETPKIMLNPYKLAPLTALIIFKTPDEVDIEVKVNNTKMTTMEKSTEHVIPIYGMYADYENEIELIASNGKNKKLNIKTDEYDGDPITLEKTSEEVKNNLYFISPNFVNNCIIDGNGNILWYIKRRLCRRY
ncbi:MAG: hypothetical protein HFJ35_03740 [Clostridia bacterium]|nr:hypothetical protein [Clostridia bacterium]